MHELPLLRQGGRDSIWLVAVEFAIVVGLFVADIKHHVFFSKTPYLVLLAWISLRWRGLRWRDVGLGRPTNWPRTIVIEVLCGIEMELLKLFVTQPLLVKLTGKILHGSGRTARRLEADAVVRGVELDAGRI